VKVIYSAVFIDNPDTLLKWWRSYIGPLHDDIKAHHMTLAFRPKSVENLKLGDSCMLRVVGYAQDENCQVVLVRSNGPQSTNTYAHVTVSLGNGTKAKYSNSLLSEGYNRVRGPLLKGTVGVFTTKGIFP
jgi:hypothetical protein